MCIRDRSSPAPVSRRDARPDRPSRAGRNLPAAIGVGVLLGGLIIVSHFWHKELFLFVATTAVCIGVWELTHAMRRSGVRVPVFPAVLGCAGMLISAYFAGGEALAVAFMLSCALIMMWRGSESVDGAAADVTGGFLVAAYPSLLAGFAMLLLAAPDGAWRSFTFVCVTVASDIGGYAVGVLAGRHPMAPTISPKTVSYTHLDVYKRQPVRSSAAARSGWTRSWCGASPSRSPSRCARVCRLSLIHI